MTGKKIGRGAVNSVRRDPEKQQNCVPALPRRTGGGDAILLLFWVERLLTAQTAHGFILTGFDYEF
jgi:hypothetical protein